VQDSQEGKEIEVELTLFPTLLIVFMLSSPRDVLNLKKLELMHLGLDLRK
jgi:hypothetical protein